MKTKVFFHYEPKDDPSGCLTVPYRVDINDTDDVLKAVAAFKTSLHDHSALAECSMSMTNETGREVQLATFADELDHSNDFFFVALPGLKHAPSSAVATPAGAASVPKQQLDANATSPSVLIPTVEEIRKVEALMKSKSFKKARVLVQHWLPSLKKQPASAEELFGLKILLQIDIFAHRYDSAVALGQYAVKKHRAQGIELQHLLAQAYAGLEDYDEAVHAMDVALSLWSTSAAQKALPSSLKTGHGYHLELLAYSAQCLFLSGQPGEAANKVNQAMSVPTANEHVGILVAYSRFALEHNKLEDALNAVLKVIGLIASKPLLDQPHAARKLLADFFSAKGAIGLFQSKLPARSAGSAEVLAYLASTAKDFSAFSAAQELYVQALQADSSNASIMLNYAHVLEMKADAEGALRAIRAFCREHPNLSLCSNSNASAASSWALSCGDFAALLDDDEGARAFAQRCSVRWVEGEDWAQVTCPAEGEGEDVLEVQATPSKRLFVPKELDLLAVFALAVKLLFLLDRRHFLPLLLQRMEAVRRASLVKLHETSVRNEMAYYQDIAQIVCYYSSQAPGPSHFSWPPVSTAGCKEIYVCGDSHCLSAAWAVLQVKGQRRHLVPKLVTGLKQWHLRDASSFHPKQSFLNALASMPVGAEVVMMVGEIDCREGLLLAVERDHYDTLDAGMQHTISIFVKMLQKMRKRQLKIWIHPVAPVLKETRPIVLLFNRYYKQAIEQMGDAQVQWLDLQDELLDCDIQGQLQLKQAFQLDGTHLRPSYVQLIEQAMNSSA